MKKGGFRVSWSTNMYDDYIYIYIRICCMSLGSHIYIIYIYIIYIYYIYMRTSSIKMEF